MGCPDDNANLTTSVERTVRIRLRVDESGPDEEYVPLSKWLLGCLLQRPLEAMPVSPFGDVLECGVGSLWRVRRGGEAVTEPEELVVGGSSGEASGWCWGRS